MTQINGFVNEKFAAVSEALQRNFADPGEIGAVSYTHLRAHETR